MADKKKSKKRKEEFPDPDEKPDKPNKEEFEVASWLRNNVPVKKTKFLNHNVQYFTGSKAVDALMASSWGTAKKEGEEPFFLTREHCVSFLDDMLRHKFFHRAKKVAVTEDMLRSKKKKEGGGGTKTEEKEKEKKEPPKVKEPKEEEQAAESSHAEGKGQELSETEDERKKKKKKKVRLEMHLQQYFADSLDAYVWIYDPIPFHYWLFGFLVVLAGIGICLFPLWPPSVRMVVYYLSMFAAGFLVFIIALAVLRSVVFWTIWLLTLGRHHLWLFPNLTEDVGFFASFWPIYQYQYKGEESTSVKKKKKKKEKLSDNEEEQEQEPEQKLEHQEETIKFLSEENGEASGSESEHSSQQSQTGKDFEIVDRAEVETN